ncbi:hypothetical protein LZD49_31230 [Dyadobacter sp. CY261]|uniref:RNA polymerase sigma factor n=1 Tax=Dyadobacter sp. CY261 TaxID=2907203 RepID=UPI001F2B0974|nr:hypothetical protein [Dyadobacter sp. CY261]MCF0074999.1 hypothetical protein [Dyadobacter sp. CY261]
MKSSDLRKIWEGYRAESSIRKQVETQCLRFDKPPNKEHKSKLARSTATSFVWIARTRTPENADHLIESLYKDQCFLLLVRGESPRMVYDGYTDLWNRLKSIVFKIDQRQPKEEVEDIVGRAIEIFTIRAKTQKSFELYSSLTNYLASVCTNLYLESYRKDTKGKAVNPFVAHQEAGKPGEDQIQMIVEINLIVAAEFYALKPRCRELLLTYYGWDEAKMAALLNVDPKTLELDTYPDSLLDIRHKGAAPKTMAQMAFESGTDKEGTLRQTKNRCLAELSNSSIPQIIEILNSHEAGTQVKAMLEDRLKKLGANG